MNNVQWKEVWKRRLHQLKDPVKVGQIIVNHSYNWPKIFAKISFIAFISTIVGTLILSVFLVILAKDLPQPGKIVRREGFATKIYDRNNNLIYDVYQNQKRTPVELYQIPQTLKDATVSIEDKEFYTHKGFDLKGYLRVIYYVFVKHRLQGGSTLTQQLVKNVLLTNERTIIRKVKEFVLSIEIESRYSKDQILQMYLNEAPYGGATYGVEEASRTYFGKSVSDLNLVESAILAGLPQWPPYYSPFGNTPEAYILRTKDVLRRMREDGKISVDQEKKAQEDLLNVRFASKGGTLKAPHFVMYVKQLLEEKYGENIVEQGGLRVITSLDLDFQEKAQEIVSQEIAKVEKNNITNGAAVVQNPSTGEILAMVGSKDYYDKNYDGEYNVTTAKRQPGSTIKPVTYVTALKKGYTAATMIMDTTTTFPVSPGQPDYTPGNYDGKEHGPLLVRSALGNSINIVAVKMLAMVGLPDMLTTAYDMGLTTLEPTKENMQKLGFSVTLGGGEVKLIDLTSAYSAFANKGLKVSPISILKVTDKQGNVLEEFRPVPGKRVLSEGEAFIISNILSDNSARLLTFSENSLLKINDRQVAVKTGTTNDRKDNWTIGWTPQIIVGVWVGNNNNTSMKQVVSGVSGAAPIWRNILLTYLKGKPKEDFVVPGDVVQIEIDSLSGYRAHDNFPLKQEYFIKGTESSGGDPNHVKLKICKGQGKLATPVDIARNDYEEKEYFIFKENDPVSKPGSTNLWQKGIDDWIAKQTDWRYHPPLDYCDSVNQINVSILSPVNQTQVSSNFTIKVEAATINDIVKIDIYIDGELKKTVSSPPYEIEVSLPDGTHTIKASATDSKGNSGDAQIKIGVNVPWDYSPSPTPTITLVPTLTPVPTLSPVP